MGWADAPFGWWLTRVAWLLFAGSSLSLLALFARWSVFLELFAHFRVQYLVVQVAAILAFVLLRRLDIALLVGLMALPHLVAVAPYLPGLARATPTAQPGQPRIVALNLQYNNDDFPRSLAYLQASGADVLVLSEFTPRAQQRLVALEASYPHRVYRPRLTAWGLGIYSRVPLLESEDLVLDQRDSAQLRVRLRLAGRLLDLYGIHVASPTGLARADLRNAQLAALADRVRQRGAAEPAVGQVVVGDLNLTPFSPVFSALLADAGLRDARMAQGLHWTWPAWPVPLWIPIDHCLVAGPVTVAAVVAGPAVGSDHLPLDIRLDGTPP